MKLVGVKEFYNITRAKVVSAINCAIVMTICATATFAVDTALNTNTVQAKPMETFAQTQETNIVVVILPDDSDQTTEPEETTTTASSASSETTVATSESTTEETDATTGETTGETTEGTTEGTTTTTAATTTEATTAETTEGITEEELYLVVYATTAINVRSGPGTEYDIVKGLYAGDQIDVCAVTSNGWYKTYNGNYVLASLTTETKPTPTPAPTPKPTSSSSSSTSSTTAATTAAPQPAPAGEGNSCTITFYGPQPNGDGTYSYSTATGTTCVEGRTCAADWSIYPAGTVIYIENDPLGGDGYYTVEDRGPGVKGYHIDIYADDGESGNHSTCTRTVYAQ
ncbi:MAG: SH3 domain-containing protein [Saccharofermentans sp.]|nr:SH3 domain-containing protein [Saccharofermentans sp.]